MKQKTIMGASIGNCVHVAGVVHFLNLCEEEGWRSLFLGPAVSCERLMEQIGLHRPDVVALGYRLTAENALAVTAEIAEAANLLDYRPTWIFGGTGPVTRAVGQLGFFDVLFDGSEDIDDCIAFIRGGARERSVSLPDSGIVARMEAKRPYPLLRHHFGLPSFEDTLAGVAEIAEAGVLDVISLGPDQNTQQFFFHPEQADPRLSGAGGVPIATAEQFRLLKEASRRGNRPLMRCYSGTAELVRFAALLRETIDNAWCAVPLSWYNELDGRGTRTIEQSSAETREVMALHAKWGVPVEVNEPHHWGMRDAHDVVSVAMAFLSAYWAKSCGVGDYIAQYMFNIPSSLAFSMDLAKVLAQIEMAESLADGGFRVYRETRAGLPLLSSDLNAAKGQLAASTMLQMAVKPDIIHVVGFSEAEQAATPEIVVESCKIVRGVVRCTLSGAADMTADPTVRQRSRELVSEARVLLDFIKNEYRESADPWADPGVLAACIRRGILDAPHIVKNEKFRGRLETRVIDGKCLAVDSNGRPISESERLTRLLADERRRVNAQ